MTLLWMLYAGAVALLLAAAAALLERPLRERELPVRWLWVGAAVGGVLLPLYGWRSPGGAAREIEPAELPPGAPGVPEQAGAGGGFWAELYEPLAGSPSAAGPAPWVERLDVMLLTAWAGASLALALVLAASYVALRRRSRAWRTTTESGEPLLVSPVTGPAILGFFRGRIVVPEWLLAGEAGERAMALRHEREHLRARDPLLLFASYALLVAVPWNVPFWWVHRRLRRAVEIDCDRRVLRAGVDPRAYGALLLRVARGRPQPVLLLTALSESPPFLERRIRLMLTNRAPGWGRRMVAAGCVATLAVAAACGMDRPQNPLTPATGAAYAIGEDGAAERDAGARSPGDAAGEAEAAGSIEAAVRQAVSREESRQESVRIFRAAIEAYHPNLLNQPLPGERVNVYLLIGARGEMLRTAVDTERRTGSCGAILAAGLRTQIEWRETAVSGCATLPEGTAPNRISVYWAAMKPRPGEASGGPRGPYDIVSVLERQRVPDRVLEAAVRSHHPDVAAGGLPVEQTLWFVVDEEGRVLHTGRAPAFGSSTAATAYLQERLPGTTFDGMLMGSVAGPGSERISIVWARRQAGAASAPLSAGEPAAPDVRLVSVRAAQGVAEVRIVLGGALAANPDGIRISGSDLRRERGDLIARTPFLLVVASSEPFEGRLLPVIGGLPLEVRLVGDGEERVTRGSAVLLSRGSAGGEIRVTAEQATMRGPVLRTVPVTR